MGVVIVRSGQKFPPTYINMIESMIAEHTNQSLTVLTDQPEGQNRRELKCSYPGWWCKLELFAPWNRDLRPCLFLDLDTYILDNINDLAAYGGSDFYMLKDFNRPDRGASGVMLIPEDTTDIWVEWSKAPQYHQKLKGGDQDFLGQFSHKSIQDHFKGIVSYKKDNRRASSKKGDRIICFHGSPKPHTSQGWARTFYDNYRSR